jgi:purine-cytosine permease-like protein
VPKEDEVFSITSATESHSVAVGSREKQYAITMGIRVVCFIAGVAIDHPVRWLFFAGAVFLPWFAVIVGNQVARRASEGPSPFGGETRSQLEK